MPGPDPLPLAGITVVSVEQAVAAPFATRHLADLGARVIKVERPGAGDFARSYDATVKGMASYFVWLNRGKQSLSLDISSAAGLAILAGLLGRADVFVQNLARARQPCSTRRETSRPGTSPFPSRPAVASAQIRAASSTRSPRPVPSITSMNGSLGTSSRRHNSLPAAALAVVGHVVAAVVGWIDPDTHDHAACGVAEPLPGREPSRGWFAGLRVPAASWPQTPSRIGAARCGRARRGRVRQVSQRRGRLIGVGCREDRPYSAPQFFQGEPPGGVVLPQHGDEPVALGVADQRTGETGAGDEIRHGNQARYDGATTTAVP